MALLFIVLVMVTEESRPKGDNMAQEKNFKRKVIDR